MRWSRRLRRVARSRALCSAWVRVGGLRWDMVASRRDPIVALVANKSRLDGYEGLHALLILSEFVGGSRNPRRSKPVDHNHGIAPHLTDTELHTTAGS